MGLSPDPGRRRHSPRPAPASPLAGKKPCEGIRLRREAGRNKEFNVSMIPDEKVREVRERAPILEVISDYMSLRKSGANYQGLCPFHGEKSPSFNVNPARG